jgi:hypothetical protein
VHENLLCRRFFRRLPLHTFIAVDGATPSASASPSPPAFQALSAALRYPTDAQFRSAYAKAQKSAAGGGPTAPSPPAAPQRNSRAVSPPPRASHTIVTHACCSCLCGCWLQRRCITMPPRIAAARNEAEVSRFRERLAAAAGGGAGTVTGLAVMPVLPQTGGPVMVSPSPTTEGASAKRSCGKCGQRGHNRTTCKAPQVCVLVLTAVSE